MRIVEPSVELLAYTQLPPNGCCHFSMGEEEPCAYKQVPEDPCSEMTRVVERCGRVSWKSEDKIAKGSADGFMTRVVNIRKDESIAEHASITLLFTTDRYVTHQLVRHRIAAYTQESTHYINYGKEKFGNEIAVCRPMGIAEGSADFNVWYDAMLRSEEAYKTLLTAGVKHYHARYALPSCLKTEIAVTFNLRMWRHVLTLRCSPNNTPEIVHVMKLALKIVSELCPPMFEDLAKQYLAEGSK